jgi:uncharacterized protein involved in response to NO
MTAAIPAQRQRVDVSPAGAPRWRAGLLLGSPHRLCFFWAGVQWLMSAGWWAAQLVGGSKGWLPQTVVPTVAWHGLWFSLGAMPLFVAGFVLTAGPRWLRTPPVDTRRLRTGVGLFSVGWLLALPAIWLDVQAVAAMLLLAAAGLACLVVRALAMLRQGRRSERLHATLITTAMGAMALTLAAAALALAIGRPALLPALARTGLWCGPVLAFVAASHRMLPFLGDGLLPLLDERWPHWSLWLLASLAPTQAGCALFSYSAALPPWLQVLHSGHLALACAASAGLTLRLLGHPALHTGVLRMLFGATLWWLLSLLLLTVAAVPVLPTAWAAQLDLAGLHALGLGYLGGTLLTMATRVSATHQGRSRAIDGVASLLYAVLQVALLTRLAALVWPQARSVWLAFAGVAWSVVAAAWLLRHGRWLGQPPRTRTAPAPLRTITGRHKSRTS